MNLQDLVDGMGARLQRDRSETQLTLGELIAALEAMPDGAVVSLKDAHSYRGYYCDLAFEPSDGMRPAVDLLAECKSAMGKVFEGYKGGDYVMGETTPIWLAEYGCTGLKLMAVHANGSIDTAEDD